MPIRIESTAGQWVEFRDTKWTFGDRVEILESTDWNALAKILTYVVAWNVKDTDDQDVPLPAKAEAMRGVDDRTVVWLIRAWFEARNKRGELPKGP